MHINDWCDEKGGGAQTELCARTGLPANTINKICRGFRQNSSTRILRLIRDATGGRVSQPEDLMPREKQWGYVAQSARQMHRNKTP